MISVVTPTYNRGYCLSNLYLSLKNQTNYDFEWIIIDDGSLDNTSEIVLKWVKQEKAFNIILYRKENGGKHRAINSAMKLVSGEYVFIVDSDDILTSDAIEKAVKWINEVQNDNSFAGVSGRRAKKDGTELGMFPAGVEYVDAKNTERIKKKLTGDKAEIYKTEILRKYPFPEFENELFLSESVVWDEIAHDGYKIRWYQDEIYLCDYQEDGLTKNLSEYVRKSPKGFALARKKIYCYYPFPYNWMGLIIYIDIAKEIGIKKKQVMRNLDIGTMEYLVAHMLYYVWKVRNKIKN